MTLRIRAIPLDNGSAIAYIISTPEGRETGRKEVSAMTNIRVTQVTFMANVALIAGEPLDDGTKVLVGEADPREALPLAMALAAGVNIEVDMPPEAVVEVLEKPKPE
jgi:hypothetical protein